MLGCIAVLEGLENNSSFLFLSFSIYNCTSTYLENKNAHTIEENILGALQSDRFILTPPLPVM